MINSESSTIKIMGEAPGGFQYVRYQDFNHINDDDAYWRQFTGMPAPAPALSLSPLAILRRADYNLKRNTHSIFANIQHDNRAFLMLYPMVVEAVLGFGALSLFICSQTTAGKIFIAIWLACAAFIMVT